MPLALVKFRMGIAPQPPARFRNRTHRTEDECRAGARFRVGSKMAGIGA